MLSAARRARARVVQLICLHCCASRNNEIVSVKDEIANVQMNEEKKKQKTIWTRTHDHKTPLLSINY